MSQILYKLEQRISTKPFSKAADTVTILFFFGFILAPIFGLFATVFLNWETVTKFVFNDKILGNQAWQITLTALKHSFQIAFVVMIIDIIIGLPMALILARYDFRGKEILDSFVDIPMAVPTSALGFSVYLFWGSPDGLANLLGLDKGLLSYGPILIIMAHVVFTYPYIVRSLKAVIQDVDLEIELAARTLGAPQFTVFRTITAPLFKEGLIAGAILAFSRSLGETGATLLVSGTFETAPIAVVAWVRTLRIPAAAFLSMILAVVAIFLLVIIRVLARRVGLPINTVYPSYERLLSSSASRYARNLIVFVCFILIVFAPSLFTFFRVAQYWDGSPYPPYRRQAGVIFQIFESPDKKFGALFYSLLTSLTVMVIVVGISLVFGIPLALIMVRRQWGLIKGVIDALIDLPLAIPSSALGFAVFNLWGSTGLGLLKPGIAMIIAAHICMTYPYMVRPLIAILESVKPEYEEAARTLGAPVFTTFRTITIPLLSRGIIAACIMAGTRSLAETGATIIVQGVSQTIPVLIVVWVESQAISAAAFASVVLILLSFSFLIILRILTQDVEETQKG
ncbi:MAG: ABC transporter permease [Candidatus Heimdallarchaeota archaeon]